MSQPEQGVSSEGVPQSQVADSAAPVSAQQTATSGSSRLNPNAVEFTPGGGQTFTTAYSFLAQPQLVPVFQSVGFTPIQPYVQAPQQYHRTPAKSRGGRVSSGGRTGYPAVPAHSMAAYFPQQPGGMAGIYGYHHHQQPDNHFHQHVGYHPLHHPQSHSVQHQHQHQHQQQQQQQQTEQPMQHMQHIMLAQQLDFPALPGLNANAQAFTPTPTSRGLHQSGVAGEANDAEAVPAEQLQPKAEEEEPADPNAPITWAQRVKQGNAKKPAPAAAAAAAAHVQPQPQPETKPQQQEPAAPAPAPAAAAEAAAAPAVTASVSESPAPVAPTVTVDVTVDEAQAQSEAEAEAAEDAEERQSTSSFMEAVAGVDGERRIYSVDFLLQFRDYSDSSIPVKELIPSHLYLQPLHEDENLSWRISSRAVQTHGGPHRGAGRGKAGAGAGSRQAPMKMSGVLLEPLKRAEHSWSALQQKLKSSSPEEDEKVERGIRGLLNKLTSDKYEKLKQQLFTYSATEVDHVTNMRTFHHITILIRLLFEKATQQHHFIPLYADLCRDCRDWLGTADAQQRFRLSSQAADSEENPAEVKEFFRRSLTEQCQQAFDSFLVVPAAPGGSAEEAKSSDDQYAEEVKYRTKVWGNLKLIGQLIARRIISSKVAMKCIEELLAQGNNETLLEALAVFLTDVARLIDNPNWECHSKLEEVFKHLASLAFPKSSDPKLVSSKCRFALQNLLDLRKANWQTEALAKVAIQQQQSSSGAATAPTTASRQPQAGTWKPRQTAAVSAGVLSTPSASAAAAAAAAHAPPVTPTVKAFKGWGQPLPGAAAPAAEPASASASASTDAKTVEEARKQSVTALQECRASRSQADAVTGLKEALEGLREAKEKVAVIADEQLVFALEAGDKDHDLLLQCISAAIPEDLDVALVLDHFVDGPLEELKIDLPTVASLVREKVLPLFPRLDSTPGVKERLLTRLGF